MSFENLANPHYDYNPIGAYLKKRFNSRVIKLSLDGDFTCPNRDGSKGFGGCVFCSSKGSGEFAGTIPSQIKLMSGKWPEGKYIAYFQNHTNTYGPVEKLSKLYYEALNHSPDMVGLAIATRPDCLSPEILDLLEKLNRETFLWVELGLQTIHPETAKTINRCYDLSTYHKAVESLRERGIRVVCHLLFGLPKTIENGLVTPETQEEMLESVAYVCQKYKTLIDGSHHIFGVKLHMLNLVKGSPLAVLAPNYEPFSSIEDYVNLVVRAISLIPPEITIHRLSADAPRDILIAPSWSYKKRTILNAIHRELSVRRESSFLV